MPMKTAYLCDIDNNAACTKTWCVINDGPCIATTDPKYAWKDAKGRPIVADDEDLREAADRCFKHERKIKP